MIDGVHNTHLREMEYKAFIHENVHSIYREIWSSQQFDMRDGVHSIVL